MPKAVEGAHDPTKVYDGDFNDQDRNPLVQESGAQIPGPEKVVQGLDTLKGIQIY